MYKLLLMSGMLLAMMPHGVAQERVAGAEPLAVEAAPEVPRLSAQTRRRGQKSFTTGGYDNQRTIRVRTLAVTAEVSFSRPPASDYQVECFFVAKNEVSKVRFFSFFEQRTFRDLKAKVEFDAPELFNREERFESFPIEMTTGFGRTYYGTGTRQTEISGSRFEGWVVVVRSQGQIVAHASNQSHLDRLIKEHPELFTPRR